MFVILKCMMHFVYLRLTIVLSGKYTVQASKDKKKKNESVHLRGHSFLWWGSLIAVAQPHKDKQESCLSVDMIQ